MIWEALVYVVLAYFIGAVPTAYIIAKKLKGIDIRQHGSGNVGSTNVRRVVGPKAGNVTMIIDILKGYIPVLGATFLFPKEVDPYQLIPIFTALAAVIGHSRSIYIGFTGGKSVNTSMGAILALEPVAAIIVALIAFAVMKLTRYVSVGSITGGISAPVVVWLLGGPLSHIVMTLFIGLYVIWLHRANIERLIKHQENRI